MRHMERLGTLRFGTLGHIDASEAAVANIRVFTLVPASRVRLQHHLPQP